MKFHFIQQQLSEFPIAAVCRALEVSRSGYFSWRERPESAGALRREALAQKIKALHEEHRRVYGSPRIHRVLTASGESVCENTVAKVMRHASIRAKTDKKFVSRTTDSQHDYPICPNVLDRQFDAPAPNRKWATDITYIPTDEGWLYLAGVLDLYSRKVVGWSMAEHMKTELVSDALEMAIARRRPGKDLLQHSDQGVQYASDAYRYLLEKHQMQPSMSGRGQCWDNACVESFWGTLKRELVNHEHYATREEARQSIFQYIEVFYNRIRLHSSLGYQSPEAFEARLN